MTPSARKIYISAVVGCLLLVLSSSKTFAQSSVVINEFKSDGSSDWIELYNNSDSEVDLKGWIIKDTATTAVHEFDEKLLIPKQGFCVVDVDSRLNNGGDRIQLYQGNDIKDCVAYGNGNGKFCEATTEADVVKPENSETASRDIDGIGKWIIGAATREYSNVLEFEPDSKNICYIPSPPTEVPASPTPIPPSPTENRPTNTPKPKNTQKPDSTAEPTAQLTVADSKSTNTEGNVLAAKSDNDKLGESVFDDLDFFLPTSTPSATPTAKLSPIASQSFNTRKKIGYIFYTLGALAIIASGVSAYKIAKST